MSVAKITLIGQETWLRNKNESVFDLLTLPDGIEKSDLCDNIILECGEFETLYSEPDFMRAAVGTWSKKHYYTFEKWITAMNLEYNPLENYDRIEDWTDTGSQNSNSKFVDDTNTKTDSTTNSHGKSDQNGNTEDMVSAFDASTYQESEKHVIDTDENHEDHVGCKTTLENDSIQTNEFHRGDSNKHNGRIHGNIGVTTSQQMLQSEYDIARFNIIQEITDLFAKELCILIYE